MAEKQRDSMDQKPLTKQSIAVWAMIKVYCTCFSSRRHRNTTSTYKLDAAVSTDTQNCNKPLVTPLAKKLLVTMLVIVEIEARSLDE